MQHRHKRISVLPFVQDPGGVGHSWFIVELTSDHVPIEEPVAPTGPGRVSTEPRRRRRERIEERFDGRYRVILSVEERHRGVFHVTEPERFAGFYKTIETTVQLSYASYEVSKLRYMRRQEEEFVLLMMDE